MGIPFLRFDRCSDFASSHSCTHRSRVWRIADRPTPPFFAHQRPPPASLLAGALRGIRERCFDSRAADDEGAGPSHFSSARALRGFSRLIADHVASERRSSARGVRADASARSDAASSRWIECGAPRSRAATPLTDDSERPRSSSGASRVAGHRSFGARRVATTDSGELTLPPRSQPLASGASFERPAWPFWGGCRGPPNAARCWRSVVASGCCPWCGRPPLKLGAGKSPAVPFGEEARPACPGAPSR